MGVLRLSIREKKKQKGKRRNSKTHGSGFDWQK